MCVSSPTAHRLDNDIRESANFVAREARQSATHPRGESVAGRPRGTAAPRNLTFAKQISNAVRSPRRGLPMRSLVPRPVLRARARARAALRVAACCFYCASASAGDDTHEHKCQRESAPRECGGTRYGLRPISPACPPMPPPRRDAADVYALRIRWQHVRRRTYRICY